MRRLTGRFAVNCSMLFTELPLLERPAAARATGFEAVEFWWPFPHSVPSESDVDAFVSAIADAGVDLIGLNFFAGDMPGGDRGVISIPGREQDFRDNTQVVVAIASATGCRAFNALYGNRIDGVTAGAQDDLATENLRYAADAVAPLGGTVLIEPLSGAPRYPLRTAADVVAVLDRLAGHGAANLAMLADLYHLGVNGDDLDRLIADHTGRIGHVQIADVPGRHEPGTGRLDLGRHLDALHAAGYTGWVALEYQPTGATVDSFGWREEENEP